MKRKPKHWELLRTYWPVVAFVLPYVGFGAFYFALKQRAQLDAPLFLTEYAKLLGNLSIVGLSFLLVHTLQSMKETSSKKRQVADHFQRLAQSVETDLKQALQILDDFVSLCGKLTESETKAGMQRLFSEAGVADLRIMSLLSLPHYSFCDDVMAMLLEEYSGATHGMLEKLRIDFQVKPTLVDFNKSSRADLARAVVSLQTILTKR